MLLRNIANQAEIRNEARQIVPSSSNQESFPEKLRNMSNTAQKRYNEIIGFSEIDQAYVKVTELQVRQQR